MTPVPDESQKALHRRLLAAMHDDPYLRFELDPGTLERVAVLDGQAVAWVGRHRSGARWATGLALDPCDPAHLRAAAQQLDEVAGPLVGTADAVDGVTVTRGGRDLLVPTLRSADAWEWDFWWTDRAPGRSTQASAYGERASVTDLAADDPRIAALLDLASPTAALRPGDPRVVRWAGVEDPDGGLPDTDGLAAVLAVTRPRSGVAHLNDVATHPERRGRGLARLLCGQVTCDGLAAGVPAVTLAMYADNDSARKLYTALGFTCARGQTSGPLR